MCDSFVKARCPEGEFHGKSDRVLVHDLYFFTLATAARAYFQGDMSRIELCNENYEKCEILQRQKRALPDSLSTTSRLTSVVMTQ